MLLDCSECALPSECGQLWVLTTHRGFWSNNSCESHSLTSSWGNWLKKERFPQTLEGQLVMQYAFGLTTVNIWNTARPFLNMRRAWLAPLVFPDYKSLEFSSIPPYSGTMAQSQFSLAALLKLRLTPEEATVAARNNCLFYLPQGRKEEGGSESRHGKEVFSLAVRLQTTALWISWEGPKEGHPDKRDFQ